VAIRPATEALRLSREPGEVWWGGAVADGAEMPFSGAVHHRDLALNAGFMNDPEAGANQSAPLLLSNTGRYVWCDNPFAFDFAGMELTVQGVDLTVGRSEEGLTIAGALRTASRRHFPASGLTPAREMFSGPQYNTWMELPYTPTQQGVLDYVRGILDTGFPPGVVMIDDRWSEDYGTWRFDRSAFPDPTEMVSTLHEWGCRVMLWIVPFVDPDSPTGAELVTREIVVRAPDGAPAIKRWWNGLSLALDLTNPRTTDWLHTQLRTLVTEHGVDGFKFDGGDLRHYSPTDVTYGGGGPVDQCEAWARIGERYAYNEFRACWKMGGRPLAQRLHDKPGTWDGHGLASLIPESIAQGLIGHPFVCPDMIGGGELAATERDALDQQLFVRYAQCAALHPMMQFSLSPRRVLDQEHLAAVLDAVRLRQELLPDILRMVDNAAASGEPILRPIVYDYPDEDPTVIDQFTLAGEILAAPVLERDATERTVRLPPGDWRDRAGTIHHGPTDITVPADLTTIPVYRRTNAHR
jgi:alpha-glucosidase (family GH31 glycosyl hydrolase)